MKLSTIKTSRIILLFYISITFLGCSSYVQRTFESQEEYFEKINKELTNKSVLVHLTNNKNEEGKFIQLNNYSLLLEAPDSLAINTNNVHSISYKKSDPSWFVGALAGFSLSAIAFAVSGARIDVGGSSKYPYMLYVIPVSTLLGSIIAGSKSDNYKTFVIQK